MCKKDNQNSVHSQEYQNQYQTLNQREKMVSSFINSQFAYCSLIWMFTSKGCNKRIDRMYLGVISQFLGET